MWIIVVKIFYMIFRNFIVGNMKKEYGTKFYFLFAMEKISILQRLNTMNQKLFFPTQISSFLHA